MMTLLDQEQPAPAPHEPFSLKILSTVQVLPRDNLSRDSSAKSEMYNFSNVVLFDTVYIVLFVFPGSSKSEWFEAQ